MYLSNVWTSKKYKEKELNLAFIRTDKKTTKLYFFFFAAQLKARKTEHEKNKFIIDFEGQYEAKKKNSIISLLIGSKLLRSDHEWPE